MERKITIAIMGFGYWGPNLVRNFNAQQNACVKYIADLDQNRLKTAQELYPSCKTITDYKEALSDPEVDAVVVATPASTHYKLASEALQKGKHVLIEKPMTRSVQEARELIDLAKKQGKVLMVDHTFQYAKPVQKIEEYVRSGELGEVFSITMSRLNLGLFQKDVNVIWDLCPHDIAILVYLLKQMPVSVSATGTDHVQKGIEDDCHVYLKFSNNVSAALHVSWLDPCKVRRIAVVGSKKMLLFDDVEPTDKIKLYDKCVVKKNSEGLPVLQYYTTPKEFQLAYRYGDILIPTLDLKEPLSLMAGDFVNSILQGSKPLSDGESGLRVVKIIEAAQKSLKNGGQTVAIGE